MRHGNEALAVPGQRPRPDHRLPAELRAGAEPALVELLRRERADVRVHAPRVVEENAAGRVDGRRFTEEVAEGGDVGAGRMNPLDGLVELAGVAQQDEAPRCLADGEGVREAHLSRLVDDEHVHRVGHLLTRPQPRGAAGEVGVAGVECLGHLRVGAGPDDAFVARWPRSGGSPRDSTARCSPCRGRRASGKTYTGARMILDLLADGKRVGVTANSHKVISNLLAAVCDAVDGPSVENGRTGGESDGRPVRQAPVELRGIQKANAGDGCPGFTQGHEVFRGSEA